MKSPSKFKIFICSVITFAAIYLVLPTMWRLYYPDSEKLPSFLPDASMELGLDLKGGVHMVLGIDLEQVAKDQLLSYNLALEQNLKEKGIEGFSLKVLEDKQEIEISAPSEEIREKVAAEIATNFTALEIKGEYENILVTTLPTAQIEFIHDRAREQSIQTIRNRIDEFGVAEPIITKKGVDQILVQFPGAKDPERLKSLIGQTAQLYFRIVHECRDMVCLERWSKDLSVWIQTAESEGSYTRESFERLSDYRERINKDLAAKLPKDTEVFFQRENDLNVVGREKLSPYLLSKVDSLSGQYLKNAYAQLSQSGMAGSQRPMVFFEMSPVGAPLLGELTGKHVKGFMAIVLDDIVKSAPQLQSQISSSGQIELGRGSYEDIQREANDTAIVLRAGALPAKIEILEERVIGPSIGRDAIEAGRKSLLVSGFFIFLFMWAYYGVSGLLANFVTLINVCLIVAVLGSMKATLTLPGIAGIVLTLGMAVDALIIIFERMREEVRAGNNPRKVIELGFEKAFSAILDSNVTTLIGGFVLLSYGTGSIRGFAFTLIVGISVNIFMATYFAHTLFNMFFDFGSKLRVGLGAKEVAAQGRSR